MKKTLPIHIAFHSGSHTISLSENNTSPEHDNGNWLSLENCITVLDLSDGDTPLHSLSWNIRLILISIMTSSLLIGCYYKGITYTSIFGARKDNHGWLHRPINVLTLASAIIHQVTHVVSGVWFAICMMAETPMGDQVGSEYCWAVYIVGVVGVVYLSFGSLGIAVYRLLYIRHENLVKYVVGEKRLLMIILALSLSFTGLVTFLFLVEDSNQRAGHNMCTGLSVLEVDILMKYEIIRGIYLPDTTYWQKIATASALIAQVIEFSIYVWFFYYQYMNTNGNIAKYLRQDDVRNRNAKNVQTFIGQFYAFMVESSFLVFIILMQTLVADENNLYIRGIVLMLKIANFGALSAVEVLTSPLHQHPITPEF